MKTIGAVIFPGFELLDLFGPLEMFGLMPDSFSIRMVAEKAGAVSSGQGPSALAEVALAQAGGFDLLLVPGGPGTRAEVSNFDLLDGIRRLSGEAEIVMSVCTGSALLAKAGLLDGKRATTNKRAFSWVAGLGPRVDWQRKARWVEDGDVFTSSGVSAGIDMSLSVIARLHGVEQAEAVANDAEYDWHRDPDWDPFAALHGLV